MTALQALERRVTAMETRVTEIESSYGGSLYELRRDSVATRIDLRTILAHMGLPAATADDVDEVLNAE